MIYNTKHTPVQNFYGSYLSFIDEENEFNEELEDMELAFDESILYEKDKFKEFFVAGMFAKDFIKEKDFDLDKYFNKVYYTIFPDE